MNGNADNDTVVGQRYRACLKDVKERRMRHKAFLMAINEWRLRPINHDMPRLRIKNFKRPSITDQHIQIRLWERHLSDYQTKQPWTKGQDQKLYNDFKKAAIADLKMSFKYNIPRIPTFEETKTFMETFFCYNAYHRMRPTKEAKNLEKIGMEEKEIKCKWAAYSMKGIPYDLKPEFWANYDKARPVLYDLRVSMAFFSARSDQM